MKDTLKEAPQLLCQLLSPFTSRTTVLMLVEHLNANPALLDILIECANRHFMVTTLYAQLQHQDALFILPEDLRAFMACLHMNLLSRNQRLQQQARFIITLFNQHEITPLLMKGVDTLFYDLYPSQGSRFMSDIDILMPSDTIAQSKAILIENGYAIPKYYQDHKETPNAHHTLPLYKAGDDCYIELHHKPLSLKCGRALTAEQAFKHSQTVRNGDIRAISLSPTHKLLHCFLHSEIAHRYQKTDYVSILQMDYFIRLLHYYQQDINWSQFLSQLKMVGLLDDFGVYWYKAQRLFSTPNLPISIPNTASKHILERRYQSALQSTLHQHYPWRRFKLGMRHLFCIFTKERLSGNFIMIRPIDYPIAIIKRLGQLLLRFIRSPKSFNRTVCNIFSRPHS